MRLPPLSTLRADTPAFAAALARPDLTTLERFYLAGCGFAVWGAGAAEANFQAWADAMLADPWPPSSIIPVAGYRKQVDPWERMLARYPEEAATLGLTDEQIDDLFRAAGGIAA